MEIPLVPLWPWLAQSEWAVFVHQWSFVPGIFVNLAVLFFCHDEAKIHMEGRHLQDHHGGISVRKVYNWSKEQRRLGRNWSVLGLMAVVAIGLYPIFGLYLLSIPMVVIGFFLGLAAVVYVPELVLEIAGSYRKVFRDTFVWAFQKLEK